jgi:hypothetical protein
MCWYGRESHCSINEGSALIPISHCIFSFLSASGTSTAVSLKFGRRDSLTPEGKRHVGDEFEVTVKAVAKMDWGTECGDALWDQTPENLCDVIQIE